VRAECYDSNGRKNHHPRLNFNGWKNLTLSSSGMKKKGCDSIVVLLLHREPRTANDCDSNLVSSFLDDLPGSEN